MAFNPFSVSAFKQRLDGGVRPAYFVAALHFKNFFPYGHFYFCRMAELPGVHHDEVTARYFSRDVKLPGSKRYQSLRLDFINDPKFSIRKPIEQWMEMQNSGKHNTKSTDWDFGDIIVTQYHHQVEFGSIVSEVASRLFGKLPNQLSHVAENLASSFAPGVVGYNPTAKIAGDVLPPKKLVAYRFVNAYPTTLDPIALDHEQSEQFETFGVQFNYQYWEEDKPFSLENKVLGLVGL